MGVYSGTGRFGDTPDHDIDLSPLNARYVMLKEGLAEEAFPTHLLICLCEAEPGIQCLFCREALTDDRPILLPTGRILHGDLMWEPCIEEVEMALVEVKRLIERFESYRDRLKEVIRGTQQEEDSGRPDSGESQDSDHQADSQGAEDEVGV